MICRCNFRSAGIIAMTFLFFACGGDSGSSAETESLLEISSCSWKETISSDTKMDKYSSSSFEDKTTANEDGSITDERDGQTYKIVQIGSQIWMAENLKYYKNISALCYDNNSQNCEKYGRLYSWATAMDSVGSFSSDGLNCGYERLCEPAFPVRGICPHGWHLPTEADFKVLINYVGNDNAAKKLKSSNGWPSLADGTDDYGFSALPSGEFVLGFKYDNMGKKVSFWAAEEDHGSWGKILEIEYDYDKTFLTRTFKNSAVSIRCLKDTTIVISSSSKDLLSSSNSSDAKKIVSSSSLVLSSASIKQSSSSVAINKSSSSSLVQSSSSVISSSSSCSKVIEESSSSSIDGWDWNVSKEARLNSDIVYDSIIDERDQQVYKIVTIGTQTWMAENLNYAGPEVLNSRWCYENKEDYCKVTGSLYHWGNNITYCPSGWHVPTDEEWLTLVKFVSDSTYQFGSSIGYAMAGRRLKSTSGWLVDNGSDDYGFSLIPAGIANGQSDYVEPYYKQVFFGLGEFSQFYTSSKSREYGLCWSFEGDDVRHSSTSSFCSGDRYYGASIRCIKD